MIDAILPILTGDPPAAAPPEVGPPFDSALAAAVASTRPTGQEEAGGPPDVAAVAELVAVAVALAGSRVGAHADTPRDAASAPENGPVAVLAAVVTGDGGVAHDPARPPVGSRPHGTGRDGEERDDAAGREAAAGASPLPGTDPGSLAMPSVPAATTPAGGSGTAVEASPEGSAPSATDPNGAADQAVRSSLPGAARVEPEDPLQPLAAPDDGGAVGLSAGEADTRSPSGAGEPAPAPAAAGGQRHLPPTPEAREVGEPPPADASTDVPAPVTPPPPAAEAPQEAAASPLRTVSRVLDAVEALEHAPPPRSITLDLADLDGTRLHVALRGQEVRVTFVGDARSAGQEPAFARELGSALADRGFTLADPAGGREDANPHRERSAPRPVPAESPSGAATPPPRRHADNGLRL